MLLECRPLTRIPTVIISIKERAFITQGISLGSVGLGFRGLGQWAMLLIS